MKSTFDDAMLSASFGRTQGQAADLRNSVRGLGQSSSAGLTQEQKNRRLRDACEGFESIFIQKMWQQMRATLPKEGLLKSRDEAYWQDMYDQELAKSMTSAGGIGLADMMFEQLSRNLVSASRTTASATAPRRTAFTADAAPLLPPSPEQPEATEKPTPGRGTSVTASIYEGSAPQEGLVPQATQEAQQKAAQAAAQSAPAPAAVTAPPAAPAAQTPPEVEQALAVLRSQQTVRQVRTTSDSRRSRSISRRSTQLTGLQMAQQAQREAGDKLGNGVRPSPLSRRSHRSVPTAGQLAAANANAAQAPAESALPPLTAASAEPSAAATAAASAPTVAAAQDASQQQPQQEQQASVRRVRYTTNLPKQKRRTDTEDLIRVLNMDSPQPSIAASAGAAAYQQQAAAAAQATTAPQGNPAMPNSRAQAVRDSAALKQMMEARGSGQAGTPVVTTGPLAPLTGA